MPRTLKLVLQYDGTDFVGWQRQAEGQSIQGVVEDALSRIEGAPVVVHAAGRTDAGVHALGQIAHARVSVAHDDETMVRALNANLPETVRVLAVSHARDDFHARFDATSKTYEYRIWNRPVLPPFERCYVWHVPQPLDVDSMQRAANDIVGELDFAAFQGAGTPVHSTVRRVSDARWTPQGPETPLTFAVTGTGFLRHMVRALVGTMVEVGRGARPSNDMPRLIALGDRHAAGQTAPAKGLFLQRVDYESPLVTPATLH